MNPYKNLFPYLFPDCCTPSTELMSSGRTNALLKVEPVPTEDISTENCQYKVTAEARARIDFAFAYYRHLKNLRIYVEAHANEPFRLKDVAVDVGISASRLSHLFFEKTGLRFNDWLCYERIVKARKMLRSCDKSIAEIAFSVGFSSTRSFERSFRKVNGLTASEFRQKALAQ